MSKTIPITEDVRQDLRSLSRQDIIVLSEISGVPFSTIMNIRSCSTEFAYIDTVSKFYDYLQGIVAENKKEKDEY